MHQQVAVVGQHPLGLVVAFQAVGQFARLLLQLNADLVADRLDLFGVGSGANHEVIGERGDARQVQNLDVGGLLGFGGAHGDQPGGGFDLGFSGRVQVTLGQTILLSVS